MGPASGAADVGDGQERPDEAYHPIVGVGYVVEQIEPRVFVEPSSNEVCLHLPQVIVELMATLKL
jgi:hypothetical protein